MNKITFMRSSGALYQPRIVTLITTFGPIHPSGMPNPENQPLIDENVLLAEACAIIL